jgi:hypothetical protein
VIRLAVGKYIGEVVEWSVDGIDKVEMIVNDA